MRNAPRALAGGWLAASALFLAACGSSSGLLSTRQAAELNAQIDHIRTALDRHRCTRAQDDAAVLRTRIEQLPSSVSATVKSSLEQGVSAVEQELARDCVSQTVAPPTSPPPATTPPSTGTSSNPSAATPPSEPGTKSKGHGHGGSPHGDGQNRGGGD